MKKRIFSMALAFALMLTLFPAGAFADDMDTQVVDTQVSEAPVLDLNIPLSTQLAGVWEFSTSPGELSAKRAALGGNPLAAPSAEDGRVGYFTTVPREIAIIDGSFRNHDSSTLSSSGKYDGKHDYVKFYDNINLGGGAATMTDVTGSYPTTTFQTGGTYGYPRAAIAADLDGNGKDDIIQVHLDLMGMSAKTAQSQNSPLGNNIGFYATVNRYGETGIRYDDYVPICDYQFPVGERFVPENVLNWSSFIQMAKGDFDGSGKEQVAVACGPEGVFIISADGGNVNRPSVTKLPLSSSTYRLPGNNARLSHFALAAGDVDHCGNDEIVAMFMEDVFTDMSESKLIVWKYNKNSNSYSIKDTISTGLSCSSVTVADINYDGMKEIVVGGFNRSDREMTLGYYKYDESGSKLSSLTGKTKLCDDELTATVNWGLGDNIDTRARNEGNKKEGKNAHRYGHSWNWAIPLERVCLTGKVAGQNYDQIFFGNALYYFNFDPNTGSGKFEPFDSRYDPNRKPGSADDNAKYMDNYAYPYKRNDFDKNNASIIALIPGTFTAPESNNIDEGREQLLVYYVKDNKDADLSFEAAFMHVPVGTSNPMDVRVTKKYLGMNTWGAEDFYPLITAPNIDDDAYLIQYVGHIQTMSDPKIMAILQGVPYYKDVPVYIDKLWGPGRTNFTNSEGKGDGHSFNFDFGAGVTASADLWVAEAGVGLQGKYSYAHTEMTTVTQSVNFYNESLDDAIVMQCMPIDMYLYAVYNPESKKWEPMNISMPGELATKTIPLAKYNQLAKKHNTLAKDYNESNTLGKSVKLLPEIAYGTGPAALFTHTPGQPWTYPKDVSAFRMANTDLKEEDRLISAANPMSVETSDKFTGVGSGINVATTMTEQWSGGFDVHAEVMVGPSFAKAGVTVDAGFMWGDVNETVYASDFTTEMKNYPNQALEDYEGYEFHVAGYEMTATLNMYYTLLSGAAYIDSFDIIDYAKKADEDETKSKDEKGIPVIAYTVQSHRGAPKLPDDIKVLREQATGNSVTIAYNIPTFGNDGLDMIPDRYKLERYDVIAKDFVEVANNLGDGGKATLPVSREGKGENTHTVTGLNSNTEYRFKMKVEKADGRVNEYLFTAKTLAVADAPIINEQPKNVSSKSGNDAKFTIKASLPTGTQQGTHLRFNWYYAEKTEEGTPLAWTPLKDGTVMQGSLAGAEISGASVEILGTTDGTVQTLELKKLPPGADGLLFGCRVAYSVGDTPAMVNSDAAKLSVTDEWYTITYESDANGTLTALSAGSAVLSGSLVPGGAQVVFTASPKDGHMVKTWMVNNVDQKIAGNTLTVDEVSGDIQVKVSYDITRIPVTYNAGSGGSLTAVDSDGIGVTSGDLLLPGTGVTFTAAPEEGMSVLGWEQKNNQMGQYETVLNGNSKFIGQEYKINKVSEAIDVRVNFGKPSASAVTLSVRDDLPANGKSRLTITAEGAEGTEKVLAALTHGGSAVLPANSGKITLTPNPEPGASIQKLTLTPPEGQPVVYDNAYWRDGKTNVTLENMSYDYAIEAEFASKRPCTISFAGEGQNAQKTEVSIVSAVSGKISIADDTTSVRSGSQITFQAWNADGATARSWNINGTSYEAAADGALTYTIPVGVTLVIAIPSFDEAPHTNQLTMIDSWIRENMEPNDPLTKGTLAVLLYGISREQYVGEQAGDFSDMDEAGWMADFIAWASSNQYMTGFSDGSSKPDDPVSRAQLITVLHRYITAKGIPLPAACYPSEIADMDQVSSWAKGAVSYFAEKGIVFTDASGNFNPKSGLTIEQTFSVLETLVYIIQNPPAFDPEPFSIPEEQEFPAVIPPALPEESGEDLPTSD